MAEVTSPPPVPGQAQPAVLTGRFPAATFIHLQPGQSAEVRFADFPWIEYGTMQANVASVDRTVRDGWIETQIVVLPDRGSGVPMQPGLTASVRVEVRRNSPLVILLQAIGQQIPGLTR